MNQELKNKAQEFLGLFELEKYGFYNLTPYSDGSIGFSAKKYFKKSSKNVSQLSVYVYENDPKNIDSEKKLLILHATYGEITQDGIRLRSDFKLSDPLDVVSRDEYFFDTANKEFYKRNKKINPNKIIKDVYDEHIKVTKPFKGFWLRTKVIFCRKILYLIFKYISKLFYFLLLLISGIRYSHEYIVDDIVEASEVYRRYEQEGKQRLKEGKKIQFLGYNASQWSIIFYSIFHAIGYVILAFLNYKPIFIKNIFNNNFLTIVYVILSLWLLEVALPISFKYLIKYFSKLSYLFQSKTIKT